MRVSRTITVGAEVLMAFDKWCKKKGAVMNFELELLMKEKLKKEGVAYG